MRILIAGCGYVGTALALRLTGAGHRVFALRRNPAGLPAPLEPIAADLGDAGSLRGLPEALDAVFYTAAAAARSEEAYRVAYVRGVENLLAALALDPAPPPRFFYASSTSVYAQDDGSFVDEDSATLPRRFTGRLVLEGERRLRASPLAGSSVRFAGIYGPGRGRLLARLRSGELRLRGGAPRYTNRIHRDDCAGVLEHLLGLSTPPPVVLAADCHPAAESEVYGWLAEALGVAPPVVEEASAEGGDGRNKRCRNARLLATGYRFRHPSFREGYAAVLAQTPTASGGA